MPLPKFFKNDVEEKHGEYEYTHPELEDPEAL